MKLKSVLDYTDDDVKWLVIEKDTLGTSGYFLYKHLSENFAWDTWHKTLEDALESAQRQYGVSKEKWVEIE